MRRTITLALLCLGAPVGADVVTGPMQGYTDEVEFGEARFDTSYRTPNGIPWRRDLGRAYGVTRHAVGWAPADLPLYIETGRDARGGFLLLSTLLADPDGRDACWTELPITERGAALRARLDREVARWMQGCAATRTLGSGLAIARWSAARRDVGRALARLDRVAGARYLPDPDQTDGDDRTFGLPSFLPQRVDQQVLDALADQCGLPRDRLRKTGATIAFRLLVTGAQESNADGRVNACVLRAAGYFPGFTRTPA